MADANVKMCNSLLIEIIINALISAKANVSKNFICNVVKFINNVCDSLWPITYQSSNRLHKYKHINGIYPNYVSIILQLFFDDIRQKCPNSLIARRLWKKKKFINFRTFFEGGGG